LTGLDIDEKARFARAAFWDALALAPTDFDSVVEIVHKTNKSDPTSQAEATAAWQITVKDHDEAKVGRSFTDAMVQTSLASIPGMYPIWDGPTGAREFGVHRAFSVPAELVPQYVHFWGSDFITAVESVGPSGPRLEVSTVPTPNASTGPTRRAVLGDVLGTRSGDKGGDANLGVFARSDVGWAWLDRFLTVERLQALLPEVRSLPIERHRLPNLRSLNFVIFGLLGDGVAGSTRRDPQAKALGEWLRSRMVPIPISVLEATPTT